MLGSGELLLGKGTKADPWNLTTPSGGSEYQAWRDDSLDPAAVVVQVVKTQVRYLINAIEYLAAMLKVRGGWVVLGGTDEQKPAPVETGEVWARSPDNPVGGWYGLKKGLRGRLGVYVPPILEILGLAEVEKQPRNNRMRAL